MLAGFGSGSTTQLIVLAGFGEGSGAEAPAEQAVTGGGGYVPSTLRERQRRARRKREREEAAQEPVIVEIIPAAPAPRRILSRKVPNELHPDVVATAQIKKLLHKHLASILDERTRLEAKLAALARDEEDVEILLLH